jgi:hypothetical protein
MRLVNNRCKKSNFEYFVTLPNRYDILRIIDGKFRIVKSEFSNDKEKIFCRECGVKTC